MSIVFNRIARKNPQTKAVAFYPTPKLIGRKTEKDLAERICRNTTLNEREARMALAEVRQGILDFLLDGYSVEFSDWASFRPTFNAKGSELEKDCTPALIQRVNVRCTLRQEFVQEVQRKARFVYAGDLHTTDQAPAE